MINRYIDSEQVDLSDIINANEMSPQIELRLMCLPEIRRSIVQHLSTQNESGTRFAAASIAGPSSAPTRLGDFTVIGGRPR